METVKINDLLHQRVLVLEEKPGSFSHALVKEIKVLEISPSSNYTKIMDENGRKYWVSSTEIAPIEILNSISKP